MNIAVDGGGLCADAEHKFGNYIFSENIIRSLYLNDKINNYTVYSFCAKPDQLSLPAHWNYKKLLPKRFWLKVRVSLEELIHPKDIFLALNQGLPLYTRSKIISFCHGLSYYYFPRLYKDSFSRLLSQLDPMMKRSDCVVVSSIKVKNELQQGYPKNKKIIVIPYGIPFDMIEPVQPKRKQGKYFLHVGMDHPIKNIKFIKDAFEKFRKNKKYQDYRLISITGGTTRVELKKLYQEATGYLTASRYESFNLPVLEALSQGCPVIGLKSSIIPEMEEYVRAVHSKNEFIEGIEEATEGKLSIFNRDKLKKQFSWRKYAKNLLKLY